MTNLLTDKERLRIVTRHKASIERNGYQASALFWSSREVQRVRFEQLAKVFTFKSSSEKTGQPENHQAWWFTDSLLDVGAGFGDLNAFLAEQGFKGRYVGLDVSPDMVFSGKCQYSGIDLREGELAEFEFADQAFDWVFLSGALNEVVDESGDYARKQIQEMYRIARKGVAFNLLNRQHEWIAKRPDLQSFFPKQMFEFCQQFADQVVLEQDYLPEDFTLYLRKEN